MTRRLFAAFAILIPCLTAACSTHRQAGTGDVAFRLVWNGTSDLDLYVQDPAGNCVFFGRKQSDTGAILDVDCNGGSNQICEHPVENVYWPKSTAPAGTYTYWIETNSLVLTEGPVPFESPTPGRGKGRVAPRGIDPGAEGDVRPLRLRIRGGQG